MTTSSRTPLPTLEGLVCRVNDADKEQLWTQIAGKLPPAVAGDRTSLEPISPWLISLRQRRGWVFALAAALLVLAVPGVVWLRESNPGLLSAWLSNDLLLENGQPFEQTQTDAQPKTLVFSDGSHVALGKHSQVSALAITSDQVLLRLVEGSAAFHVTKGGPRRWRIEAGVAAVEVVGTRFSIERSAAQVLVTVSEGRVLVRSPLLPDGVTRLDAGGKVKVGPALAAAALDVPAGLDVAATPKVDAALSVDAAVKAPSQPQAPSSPLLSVEDLLNQADTARSTGDPERARAALRKIVLLYPSDPRAPLSSFQLGRLEQRDHHLTQAEQAYRWALEHGASGTLAEDCYLRLIETQLGSPHSTTSARKYMSRFPQGRYRATIEKMVATPAAPHDEPDVEPKK